MTNKEKGRNRKFEVRVKLTESEWRFCKDKAGYCNFSMSELIRRSIFDGYIIKYQAFDIKELSNELNKIGVNINQIARHVNEKGIEYDRQDIDDLIKEFQNIQTEVYAKIWGLK